MKAVALRAYDLGLDVGLIAIQLGADHHHDFAAAFISCKLPPCLALRRIAAALHASFIVTEY